MTYTLVHNLLGGGAAVCALVLLALIIRAIGRLETIIMNSQETVLVASLNTEIARVKQVVADRDAEIAALKASADRTDVDAAVTAAVGELQAIAPAPVPPVA